MTAPITRSARFRTAVAASLLLLAAGCNGGAGETEGAPAEGGAETPAGATEPLGGGATEPLGGATETPGGAATEPLTSPSPG